MDRSYKVNKVRDILGQFGMADCINNDNITPECLSKGKLHLNARVCGRLAMNFKTFIKHL